MQQPSRLQISDLEPIESGIMQKIALEEAENIVGGKQLRLSRVDPIEMPPLKPPKKKELGTSI